ncbi:MAG: cobalamin-dependent protein [Gammaproteobacteria bacterium]|nr:cobalamin-dependent protein [Gammaproteobacteria bacterium]
MRVLLVYPNAKKEIIGWGDMGAIAEPIALEYIAAVARDCGHEVRLLDLRLHVDDLDQTLLDFEPDIVGVTGYSMHVLRALEICARAKELFPSCVTVAGGHHATLEPIDFFEPQMDYVVVREGTQPFRNLLNALSSGRREMSIPGVWGRIDGEFSFGGEAPAFDIDAIPMPDRSLCIQDRSEYYIDWMKPIALMRTTVGCPYRCSFCSLWRIMDGKYYKREIERVVDEMEQIPERYIFLVDDEPFVNSRRMGLMADLIESRGVDKEFFSYCRIDSMLKDLDLMKRWRDIGLRRLLIGVETIFDHELADYNKRQQRAQIVQGIAAAKDAGLKLFCNFIVHPNYTHAQFDELISFIRDNGVDYPSFTIWTPIPGTNNSFDQVIERQANGRPNWDYFDLQHPVIETRLPREEFQHRYDGLYQVFAANYLRSDSPLAVQDYKQRWEQMVKEDPNILTAMLALGGGVRRDAKKPVSSNG